MDDTVTSICNMALGRIGVSQFLKEYENDQSNEASACRVFYDSARDRVLQEMPWGFATRTAPLMDLGTPPAGWAFRYRYPSDCLLCRKVTAAGAAGLATGSEFQVIENEAAGEPAIVTDQPDAVLVYTARITKVTLFSQSFIDALAWSLAMDLASPLSASFQLAQSASQAYQFALQRAMARHLNEGREQQQTADSAFILARQ